MQPANIVLHSPGANILVTPAARLNGHFGNLKRDLSSATDLVWQSRVIILLGETNNEMLAQQLSDWNNILQVIASLKISGVTTTELLERLRDIRPDSPLIDPSVIVAGKTTRGEGALEQALQEDEKAAFSAPVAKAKVPAPVRDLFTKPTLSKPVFVQPEPEPEAAPKPEVKPAPKVAAAKPALKSEPKRESKPVPFAEVRKRALQAPTVSTKTSVTDDLPESEPFKPVAPKRVGLTPNVTLPKEEAVSEHTRYSAIPGLADDLSPTVIERVLKRAAALSKPQRFVGFCQLVASEEKIPLEQVDAVVRDSVLRGRHKELSKLRLGKP